MNPLNQGCDCAKEVSADFLMEEMTWFNLELAKYTDTDTIYANRNVHFFAKEANAEYTWIIGAEEVHEREFYRYFDASLIGQTLEMKLIVNKPPNLICLPNDDGKDTLTRYLTIVQYPAISLFSIPNPRFEGLFRLKNATDSDSVDVQIGMYELGEISPGELQGNDRFVFTNMDGLGGHVTSYSEDITYRQVWPLTSAYEKTRLYNRPDGVVELELIPYPQTVDVVPTYRFKGRKLN